MRREIPAARYLPATVGFLWRRFAGDNMKTPREIGESIAALRSLAPRPSLDDAITFLHDRGLSKVYSIVVIERFFSMARADAKHAVDVSSAWKGRRDSDEKFHAELARELGITDTDPEG